MKLIYAQSLIVAFMEIAGTYIYIHMYVYTECRTYEACEYVNVCVCVLAYMESALCLITYPEHGQRSQVSTRGVWRRSRRRRSFSQDKQREDAAQALQISWTNNYIFLVCAFIRPGTNALTIAFPLSVTGAKFQQSCKATTTTTRTIK